MAQTYGRNSSITPACWQIITFIYQFDPKQINLFVLNLRNNSDKLTMG